MLHSGAIKPQQKMEAQWDDGRAAVILQTVENEVEIVMEVW